MKDDFDVQPVDERDNISKQINIWMLIFLSV